MSPRSSARKKLAIKFRTSSALITFEPGSGVVRVGTGVRTGVNTAGVIGTGVEVPVGVTAGFSGGPFFFWPRYHPAPPTITKAAIVIAMTIDVGLDGRIGGFGIDGFAGRAGTSAAGREGLFSTALTIFAKLSKWGSKGGEKASIHCEVEMKYSSDLLGGISSTRNGMM